ncbi:MAG: 4-(cytidine 5'-diphospho)-2-C-methyl-D-erythritol kinase [Muribaculaceae bacterium]|nr:4-(cytidine 5'-diphospho)-2-C-methyl-D-erythritol kinase [Muribaculaceae bacterium]
MILFPNAKINLGLNITERRTDGYHNIESMFLPVKWKDVLEIVPSRDVRTHLTVYGNKPDCPVEKNLVMKAYNALSALAPIPPADIYLEKIIPDGAGLGGGSSDAAFTLKGLNELFELGYTDYDLAKVASTIGADCTFFIYNRPMIATGIGTELSEVDFDCTPYYIVIVKPDVSVSTKEAYAGVAPASWETPLSTLIYENKIDDLKNDFEASIFTKYPALGELKQRLFDSGAVYASMSGSGSAVYGLFTDKITAECAAKSLQAYPYVFVDKL